MINWIAWNRTVLTKPNQTYTWKHLCWSISKHLHSPAQQGHWMQSREPTESDVPLGRMTTESMESMLSARLHDDYCQWLIQSNMFILVLVYKFWTMRSLVLFAKLHHHSKFKKKKKRRKNDISNNYSLGIYIYIYIYTYRVRKNLPRFHLTRQSGQLWLKKRLSQDYILLIKRTLERIKLVWK